MRVIIKRHTAFLEEFVITLPFLKHFRIELFLKKICHLNEMEVLVWVSIVSTNRICYRIH